MMGNQNPPMEKNRIISVFFSEGRDLSNASSKEGIKKLSKNNHALTNSIVLLILPECFLGDNIEGLVQNYCNSLYKIM